MDESHKKKYNIKYIPLKECYPIVMAFCFESEAVLRQQFLPGDLGTWLPDVIGAAAGCFGVAVFPRALRDGARAVGEQLVPEVAGETSRAVW